MAERIVNPSERVGVRGCSGVGQESLLIVVAEQAGVSQRRVQRLDERCRRLVAIGNRHVEPAVVRRAVAMDPSRAAEAAQAARDFRGKILRAMVVDHKVGVGAVDRVLRQRRRLPRVQLHGACRPLCRLLSSQEVFEQPAVFGDFVGTEHLDEDPATEAPLAGEILPFDAEDERLGFVYGDRLGGHQPAIGRSHEEPLDLEAVAPEPRVASKRRERPA